MNFCISVLFSFVARHILAEMGDNFFSSVASILAEGNRVNSWKQYTEQGRFSLAILFSLPTKCTGWPQQGGRERRNGESSALDLQGQDSRLGTA